MPMIQFTVDTTGSAGSATGTADIQFVSGYVHFCEIDFNASAPASTTVTITEKGGAGRTIVSLPAGNTDKVFYPQVQASTTAGVAITGVYQKMFVTGNGLTITVDDCDALAGAVTGFLQVEAYP